MTITANNVKVLQAGIAKFKRNGWAIIGLVGFKESEIRVALNFFLNNSIEAEHVQYNSYTTQRERLPNNGVLKLTSR